MNSHPLPAGHHDAESAAQLLGISKKALLKKMRELGWLNVGGGPGNHNLPRRELALRGYLSTQERGYCLKGKKEIARNYQVMLLTQAGFNALKTELAKQQTQQAPAPTPVPEAAPQPTTAAPPPPEPVEKVVPFNRETADAAREKTLDQINRLLAS